MVLGIPNSQWQKVNFGYSGFAISCYSRSNVGHSALTSGYIATGKATNDDDNRHLPPILVAVDPMADGNGTAGDDPTIDDRYNNHKDDGDDGDA